MNSLREALDDLARLQPHLVDDARAAWGDLVDGDSPAGLTQWRLQNYCWHTLVHDATMDAARRWRVALALAALLDALGMGRYAAIARGDVTRDILHAGSLAGARRRALVRRALERSGIEPPDTELISWGPVAGPAEARTREAVADRLEFSVAAGDLQPATRGWRDQQADITIAVLTTPHSRDGLVPYEQILDERIEEWIDGPRSPTRQSLLTPLAAGLREPVAPGLAAPARGLLRPLDWLLREVDNGIALTPAGYLPPRTVTRALEELGWRAPVGGAVSAGSSAGPVREVDAPLVGALREAAMRLGLVRRRGGRLVLTPSGREAVADGRTLWLCVASGFIGPDHSALAVAAEVVLAVLETGHPVPEADLRQMVHAVVTESGWRPAARWERSTGRDTAVLFDSVVAELRCLNLEQPQEPGSRCLQARPSAVDLFRAALRHRVLHRLIVPF